MGTVIAAWSRTIPETPSAGRRNASPHTRSLPIALLSEKQQTGRSKLTAPHTGGSPECEAQSRTGPAAAVGQTALLTAAAVPILPRSWRRAHGVHAPAAGARRMAAQRRDAEPVSVLYHTRS